MKDELLKITKNTEWVVSEEQDNIKFIQFFNGKKKINVYWGPMTVMIHDLDSHYQDVKKHVTLEEIKIIMGLRTNFVQKFKIYMKNIGL